MDYKVRVYWHFWHCLTLFKFWSQKNLNNLKNYKKIQKEPLPPMNVPNEWEISVFQKTLFPTKSSKNYCLHTLIIYTQSAQLRYYTEQIHKNKVRSSKNAADKLHL